MDDPVGNESSLHLVPPVYRRARATVSLDVVEHRLVVLSQDVLDLLQSALCELAFAQDDIPDNVSCPETNTDFLH
jgi:hypothetical protein